MSIATGASRRGHPDAETYAAQVKGMLLMALSSS